MQSSCPYTQADLDALHESRETVNPYGTPVVLKKSTSFRPGGLDGYERSYRNPDPAAPPATPPQTLEEELAWMRDLFGCHNYNLNTREIITRYEEWPVDGRTVGLWRYRLRRGNTDPRPCLFYIHGGGWAAGSTTVLENPCKLVAELADAVVFNLDYTLAPEGHFPISLDQAWAMLEHIRRNAAGYGIDPDKIMAAGDSAGGNLTAALALRDRDAGTHYLAAQFMLYPAVVFGDKAAPGYEWRADAYEMAAEEEETLKSCLGLVQPHSGDTPDPVQQFYLPDAALAANPYVSPMLAGNFVGLPRAVVATAEFDGLRLQGEFYAAQLAKAGVPVRAMRYCGCTHAYLDKLGYLPQAEDVCREMAQELLRL